MSRFVVTVSSRFEELWRYNIILVGELCAGDGSRIDYSSLESFVAPVGSNLVAPPDDYSAERTLRLKSGEGEYINILVYVLPHTLPISDDIYATKPFSLRVKVERDGESVESRVYEINQWSGDNISLERVGLTQDK